jgi:hypothetical protein
MTTIPFTPDLTLRPEVTAFFDAPTNTISYVVKDPNSSSCAVIDSVMDIDYAASPMMERTRSSPSSQSRPSSSNG